MRRDGLHRRRGDRPFRQGLPAKPGEHSEHDPARAAIAAHPPFQALARRLDTVPGVGPVLIAALIAWLPELGRIDPL